MTRGRPRWTTVLLAGVLLVGVVPALAGCSVVEGVIESQTGTDVDLGGDSVPADFPADVPLAAGDVINGSAVSAAGGERVWNVIISVADPAAPESIAAQLEAAGFVSTGVGGVTGDGGTLTYTKDAYVVNVLMAKTGDGWTANYTVARSG